MALKTFRELLLICIIGAALLPILPQMKMKQIDPVDLPSKIMTPTTNDNISPKSAVRDLRFGPFFNLSPYDGEFNVTVVDGKVNLSLFVDLDAQLNKTAQNITVQFFGDGSYLANCTVDNGTGIASILWTIPLISVLEWHVMAQNVSGKNYTSLGAQFSTLPIFIDLAMLPAYPRNNSQYVLGQNLSAPPWPTTVEKVSMAVYYIGDSQKSYQFRYYVNITGTPQLLNASDSFNSSYLEDNLMIRNTGIIPDYPFPIDTNISWYFEAYFVGNSTPIFTSPNLNFKILPNATAYSHMYPSHYATNVPIVDGNISLSVFINRSQAAPLVVKVFYMQLLVDERILPNGMGWINTTAKALPGESVHMWSISTHDNIFETYAFFSTAPIMIINDHEDENQPKDREIIVQTPVPKFRIFFCGERSETYNISFYLAQDGQADVLLGEAKNIPGLIYFHYGTDGIEGYYHSIALFQSDFPFVQFTNYTWHFSIINSKGGSVLYKSANSTFMIGPNQNNDSLFLEQDDNYDALSEMVKLHWVGYPQWGASANYIFRSDTPITDITGMEPFSTTGCYSDQSFTAWIDYPIAEETDYYYAVIQTYSTEVNSSLSNCIRVRRPAFNNYQPTAIAGNFGGSVSCNLGQALNRTFYFFIHNAEITPFNVGSLTPIISNMSYLDLRGYANGTYYAAIIVHNGTVNSTLSNCVQINVYDTYYLPPLTSPVLADIAIPATDRLLALNWTAVPGAVFYRIYRNSSAILNVSKELLVATGIKGTAYNLTHKANGTYYYAVVAVNYTQATNMSNCVAVSMAPTVQLAPELSLNATQIHRFLVILNWSTPPNAVEYRLYRNTSVISNITGLTPLISGLTNTTYWDNTSMDGTYYYAVIAISYGDVMSNVSNCVSVIIDNIPPPNAPVLSPISSPNQIGNVTLDWNDVTQANSYKLYRNLSIITNVTGLTPLATNILVSNYQDNGLNDSTTYYYVVVAVNTEGISLRSNCVAVTIDILRIPQVPSLSVVLGSSIGGNVTLDWNEVRQASSYKLYRSSSYITNLTGLTPIASNLVESTYRDLNLSNGTYYYVVVAVNILGDSNASNCLSIQIAYSLSPPQNTPDQNPNEEPPLSPDTSDDPESDANPIDYALIFGISGAYLGGIGTILFGSRLRKKMSFHDQKYFKRR